MLDAEQIYILGRLSSKGSFVDIGRLKSVLVISHQGLGDLLLSYPIYRSLRAHPFNLKVHSTIKSNNEFSFLAERGLSDIPIFIKDGSILKKIGWLFSLLKYHVDLVVCPAGLNINNAIIISLFARSRMVLSPFSNKMQKLLISHPVEINPLAWRYFNNALLAYHIRSPEIGEYFDNSFSYILKKRRTEKRHITFHSGSGQHEKHKRWPAVNFITLAEMIRSISGVPIKLIVGPVDMDSMSEELYIQTSKLGIDVLTNASLHEVVDLISGSMLFVSGHSGLMHVAILHAITTISVYGPTPHLQLDRQSARNYVLNSPAICAPCYPARPEGCAEPFCMNLISPDDVFDVIKNKIPEIFCESPD